MVHSQDWHDSTGFASLYRNQAEITVLMREWPGTTGSTLQGKEGKKSVSEASRAPSLPLGPLCLVILVVCLLPPVRTPGPNVWMGWKPYDLRTGAKAIRYRIKWPVFRGGSTPVSTVLRKSVRFFIINIFLIIIIIIELSKMVWTNVFFFQFPGIKQKPGKGNFRDLKSQNITGGACPRAPLEACSLGPSFRKSVSIYPRSAPGVCRHGVVTLDRKVSVKRRKEWTDCLAVVSCSHSYRCSNLC